MTTPQTNHESEAADLVTLMEGARDFKPRPEAFVNWPKDRPPGGRLTQTNDGVVRQPQQNAHTKTTKRNRRQFLIKVAGLGDLIDELYEEPLSEPVLQWLAEQLNKDQTNLMINPPSVGSRGPKESPLDVQLWAGFTARDSAYFDAQGLDGPGVYAEVEVMPAWVELVSAMINSPAGIDLTAFHKNSVVSLDVVVQSRGTGKVVAQIEAETT